MDGLGWTDEKRFAVVFNQQVIVRRQNQDLKFFNSNKISMLSQNKH